MKFTKHTQVICGLALALSMAPAARAQHYIRTDLTRNSANASATAPNTDTNLVNAWGLSRGSGGPWWISDNGTGLSTLYNAGGVAQKLVVTIPPPPNQQTLSSPTGTVFNFTQGFEVAPGKPAVFLFVTEDGTISGWNPSVNSTAAILKVNRTGKAVYKGCAVAMTKGGPRLYVTNFQSRRVEVYDGNFNQVGMGEDAFHFDGEQSVNGLQLAPFGIQNIGGGIVVTFAYRLPGDKDEAHGAGLGQMAIFDVSGHRALRLQHGNYLNAPWGIAMAPYDFGAFSHRLLIGNFGDGTIQVFNSFTGQHEGTLLGLNNNPLRISGLWALSFGGGNANNGLSTDLYFTAGPNDENDGLLGKITASNSELRGNSE